MRTPQRAAALCPTHRTALAAALALSLGAFDAHALNQTVSNGTGISMSAAITAMNADYAARVAVDSTATCAGEQIVVDGSGGFVVAEPTPLPPLNCPGISILGTGDGTYGGRISGGASFFYGGCGLNAGPGANIDSLEIEGFSNGPGLCGSFGSIKNSHLHDNQYGLQGSVSSFTGNTVHGNTAIGIDLHNTGSGVGGASAAGRNYIFGNGTGIAVEYGGSADIGFNYIGTADGTSAYGGNSTGVALFGNASSVHDNLISANFNTGIEVDDAGGSVIRGNTIGLDANGTTALDNGQGILAWTPVSIDANIVSGNTYNIEMHAAGAVTGNLIGLDASGTDPVSNSLTGVLSLGSTPPDVSGNTIAGVQYPIEFDNASGGSIQGNRIGLNAAGSPVTGDLAQYVGISLYCSNSVTIKGSNIVGAMSEAGVGLYDSSGSTISGNYIGVANDGKTALGNTGVGIQIGAGGCAARLATGKRATSAPSTGFRTLSTGGNTIQSNVIAFNLNSGIQVQAGAASSGNQIMGNTITGNGGPATGSGVSIEDNGSVSNTIVDNAIYGNSPKNINLNTVDPTAALLNDTGDADTGPNDGLNYPEITAVSQDGTNTTIDFNMNVPAGAGSYHVQFFANAAPSPGGQSFAGSMDVSASGIQAFRTMLVGTYDNISATSTVVAPVPGATAGDTSEFSPVVASTRVPGLTVSPSSFNFGNIEAGATSATSTTFTLQSVGLAPYTLHTFLTSGVCGDISSVPLNCNGTGFICSTDCVYDQAMPPGSACTVTASFAPQTVGPDSLTISLCPITGATQQIQISGSGTLPPPVSITPNGLNFGNVAVGSSSGAQAFTISNPARTPVALTALTATGPFSVSSTTCGASLPALSSCTANVVFTPSTLGVGAGQLNLTFTSTATGTPVTVPVGAALAGTGVAAVQLTLPSSVNVGTYVIGLAPATATATVANSGTTAAGISAIAASAPFSATSDCGTSLAAGASCTITITLASTSVGPVSGNVSVTTAAGSQLIALSGIVAPAAIKLVPAQVDFGQVLVNKSATRDIVATNTTAVKVALGTPTTSGPFSIASSTCGPFLSVSNACTITVAFAPQRGGAASGALALDFGVNVALAAAAAPSKRGAKAATSGATAIATLTGSGIDAAALDMPSLLEFGTYIVGSVPIVRTATVTSSGTGVVTFQEISAAGPFGLTSDCPSNLAPGASCTLTISYNSSTLGQAAGLVTIRSNAIGGLRTISLGALTQLKPTPIVSVKPSTISFGNRLIGTRSPAVTVTVENSGGAVAILGPLTISSDYVIVSTTCGASLEAQASCTADVAMRPIGFGPRPGSLAFTSNADGSPHSVGLGGAGCRPPAAAGNRGTSSDSCAP